MRRYLFTAILIATLSSCSHNATIPLDVAKAVMGNSYEIDTICQVGRQTYRVIYNPDYCQTILFDNDKVLAESPLLEIDSVKDDTFTVGYMLKRYTIDFANPQSVAQLEELSPNSKLFTRLRYAIPGMEGTKDVFGFTIDVPNDHMADGQNVRQWLASLVADSSSHYASPDFEAMAKESATQFFNEFDREPTDDAIVLNGVESFTVYDYTDSYLTYFIYAYEYAGGAHGTYSASLATFSTADNVPVTNKLLYGKDYYKPVTDLIIDAIANDKDYQHAHDADNQEQARAYLEEWNNSQLPLPQPALTPQGVVYCFQPYEIGSYAEGAYQFVIPYSKVTPLLTPEGMKLISAK